MAGYLGVFLERASVTGLGSALGAVLGDVGADPIDDLATVGQGAQPNETPRDPGFFASLFPKIIDALPTVITGGVHSYGAYEAAGGGRQGYQAALFDAFGGKPPTPALPPIAPPTPPMSTGTKVVLAAAAAGGLYALTRKRR